MYILFTVCMCVYLLCVSSSAHRRRPAFAAFVCALFSVEISRFQRVKTAHRAKALRHTHMHGEKKNAVASFGLHLLIVSVGLVVAVLDKLAKHKKETDYYTHTQQAQISTNLMYVCVCHRIASSWFIFYPRNNFTCNFPSVIFNNICIYICMYLHVVSRKPKGNVKILSTCSGSLSLRKRCRLARHYMRTHTCTNIYLRT